MAREPAKLGVAMQRFGAHADTGERKAEVFCCVQENELERYSYLTTRCWYLPDDTYRRDESEKDEACNHHERGGSVLTSAKRLLLENYVKVLVPRRRERILSRTTNFESPTSPEQRK